MATPRFVRYTDPDGNTMGAILLQEAGNGEGSPAGVLMPLDAGSGAMANTEATPGTGPGTYQELA